MCVQAYKGLSSRRVRTLAAGLSARLVGSVGEPCGISNRDYRASLRLDALRASLIGRLYRPHNVREFLFYFARNYVGRES